MGPVKLRCTWRSATPACLVIPPTPAALVVQVFFHAALTSPPYTRMGVRRDDCEAAQRCFITGDPFFRLGLLHANTCSQPRAAFKGVRTLFHYFFAVWGLRKYHHRMCPPAVE